MDCGVSPSMKSVRSVHDMHALALMGSRPQHRLSRFCAADLSRCEVDGAAMKRHWFAGTVAQWLCRLQFALEGPGLGPAPPLLPAGRECCPHCSMPPIACSQSIIHQPTDQFKPAPNQPTHLLLHVLIHPPRWLHFDHTRGHMQRYGTQHA